MYITRIRYNETNWLTPSQVLKRSKNGSFTEESGFGYEDWLFRFEWLIAGWHYGFLQGVNKSNTKLIKQRRAFDITLFYLNPKNQTRHYLCIIHDVECLTVQQAEEGLKLYQENGWFNQMKSEIASVQGDVSSLEKPHKTTSILNIRFKPENVTWLPDDLPVPKTSPLYKWNRYNLQELTKDSSGKQVSVELHERVEQVKQRTEPRRQPFIRSLCSVLSELVDQAQTVYDSRILSKEII